MLPHIDFRNFIWYHYLYRLTNPRDDHVDITDSRKLKILYYGVFQRRTTKHQYSATVCLSQFVVVWLSGL
jgi:hypothetical protein